MKNKRRFRVLEWGKTLLILLLAVSAVYLLGRAQMTEGLLEGVRDLVERPAEVESTDLVTQASSATIHPARIAVYQDELRYGVQYNQDEADAVFSSLSIVLSEALGSAGAPEAILEREWQRALCSTGIYMDFLYPVSLRSLSALLDSHQENAALTGTARRICVAADAAGGVSLYFVDEENGAFYACATTLSSDFHLDAAVAEWAPNGAQFAFEVAGMESLEPYTLLTTTPQPAVYRVSNPLVDDGTRVSQLLSTLTFQSQGKKLDPTLGGQIVESNDSIRLSAGGVVMFHTIGDEEFRFALPENSTLSALEYVQALVESTVGAWCGQARVCLAGVEETADGIIVTFQYSLNGASVVLPEGNDAARFVIRNGAVTDFSLCLRTYSATEETSLVLPVAQAAAAMGALDADGKELTLLYQDSGGEKINAVWIAA